jgi:CRP-like cAMP-binding protein
MNQSQLVANLAKVFLFAHLPQSELEQLAATLQPYPLTAGTILIREAESDEHIFLLLEGEAEVIKALGTPDERLLAVRPAGSLFGEMSLFDTKGSHTASVRVRGAAVGVEMSRQEFDQLLQRYPILAYDMARQVSQHLAETENATILDREEPRAHPGLPGTPGCAGTADHQGTA